ncbi:SAGA-associated factor 29 isoform 1-T2 [Hipposideros larvatus]
MALVSADSRIAELLTELHQLIKQTQEERSRSEHNLVNIQKTHERMQTENKISPYYRTKLRGLYTTAKADAEAECNILRKALDKIAEIKSLLEERRIAAKIAGLYNDSEPPRKTMRRGVLMTLLQQSAMTLPLWIGKPGDKPPPLCGAIPASGDYVAKPGDKVAARVKAVDGDEQWILAEVVSYSHATNKYEVDDIDEEGKERHTLSRRRIIPLPQWKANPETDPEALFQKEQLVLALYPQTTCFYRALIHTPPQRPQDDYSVLFEDTSYADGYSPPLNVAQRPHPKPIKLLSGAGTQTSIFWKLSRRFQDTLGKTTPGASVFTSCCSSSPRDGPLPVLPSLGSEDPHIWKPPQAM